MSQPRTTSRPDLPADRAANLAENPRAGQGAVMLDIGGDVGALVVRLEAAWEGVEIEIVAGDDQAHTQTHAHRHTHDHPHPEAHGHRPHVAVVGRPAPSGVVYSAVFPELTQGRYAVGRAGGPTCIEVQVTGGRVTEVDWPEAAPDAG